MRAAVGLISLLIALVAVGLLAKKQLKAVSPAPAPALMHGEQLQRKFKQAVEAGMQPRALPDDEK